jgi:hypothetical protein
VFGAGGLGHEAGGLQPPLASPAPISLACPHGEEEGSALLLGIGLRLWQSALSFASLSFVYKSIVFPSLWIDRQLSFFIPSLLLSTFGMVGFLMVVLASSGGLVHSDCSQRVVVMK